jgi:hypothetical protein
LPGALLQRRAVDRGGRDQVDGAQRADLDRLIEEQEIIARDGTIPVARRRYPRDLGRSDVVQRNFDDNGRSPSPRGSTDVRAT